MVIPESLQSMVLEMCHDIPAAGHQNHRESEREVFWYGMSGAIKNYVGSCDICSRNKEPNRKERWALTQFWAGAPPERFYIDLLEPLFKTEQGNEHILMIVDQFTKWLSTSHCHLKQQK